MLRWLHRYLGAVVALFLIVLALSGGALVYKENLWRLEHPVLARAVPDQDPTEVAAAFRAIAQTFGAQLGMIRLPREGLAAYHVYLGDAEALLAPGSLQIIDRWAWQESPTGILAELHFHLAAGEAGGTLVGVLGLLLAGFALSGLILWWPVRRQFRLRSLRPNGTTRAHWLRLHRDLGVLMAPLVLLFALTGAGVVFYDASRGLLHALLSPGATAPTAPRIESADPVPPPDAAMIARAGAALPNARLISWSPPAPGSAVHYFRFRLPDEPHPFGRSTVHVDGRDGALLQVWDATHAARGERALHWLYPLHAARVGGWPYRLLALVTALALAVACVSGLLGFLKALRRRRGR